MKNFWQELPKPFFVLAPMENVTDTVYRQIIASCAKPDVFFTEFTSAEGLLSKGKEKVFQRFWHTDTEQPLIAQIWGKNPEAFFAVAQEITHLGFAGIDINMGCPDKSVTHGGSGSGLIKNPSLAKELIDAVKKGAPQLPVSVKTRIGFTTVQTIPWTTFLLEQDIDALTIHGRTKKEMSKVPAHWDEIQKVVEVRNLMKKNTVIIGNGDVNSREDGIRKVHTYHVDGVMVGKGIFSNIWFFEKTSIEHTHQEYLEKLLDHTHLFTSTWKGTKDFLILRKFYKTYVRDFPGAWDLRTQLMQVKSEEEVETIVGKYIHIKK